MLDVTLGGPRQHRNLTIYPLVAPGADDLPYELLVDALGAGTLTIAEVGQGTVPTLAARNAGPTAVLVLDGEQLIGARQNRMTNRSILLPAGSSTEIPVYCMEQGRWHFDSDSMAPAPQHSPAKMRRRARETEARHAAAGGAAPISMLREAQGDVWSDVADTLSALDATSATLSLHAAYAKNAGDVASWLTAFPRADDQVGLLAFVAGAPLGMDLVGAPRLYERLHQRLLRGYVLDALEQERRATEGAVQPPSGEHAQRYLDAVRGSARTAAPSVGIGTYSVLSGAVVGGELVDGGRIAHLSAFPVHEPRTGGGDRLPNESPVAPPSTRRRHL
jgi:hypothetical protein